MLNPKSSVAGGNLLPSLLLRGTVKIKRGGGQIPNLDHIQPLFGGGGRVRMTQFMDVNAAPRVNCVGE